MLAIAVVEADLFGTKKSLDADILPLEEASLLPYFHNSLLYVEGGNISAFRSWIDNPYIDVSLHCHERDILLCLHSYFLHRKN